MKKAIELVKKPYESGQPPLSGGLFGYLAKSISDAADGSVIIRETLLRDAPSRWPSLCAAIVLQAFFTLSIALLPILFPEKFDPVRHYLATILTRPEAVDHWKLKSQERFRAIPPRHFVTEAPRIEAAVTPRITIPTFRAPVVKSSKSNRENPPIPDVSNIASQIPPSLALAAPGLDIPTLKKPREDVQTGEFTRHDGLETGNSSTGSKTSRGGVVNARFSEGVLGGSGANPSVVRDSSFDEHTSKATSPSKSETLLSAVIPVRITDKPKPAYTSEARSKKIEGEVLLQVLFTASGEVQVQKVLKGLGYGLDESAQDAARRIHFLPAEQNGQAVDSLATVHIAFELAY